MVSKRLGMLPAMVALLAILATWLPAAPAHAQGHGRGTPVCVNDGEPTDPDGVAPVRGDETLKIDGSYGLSEKGPDEASAPLSWLEAVLDLLRALNLLPAEESKE